MLPLPQPSVATVLAVALASVAWRAGPSPLPVSEVLEAFGFPGFEMGGRWWPRGSDAREVPWGAVAAHSPGHARQGWIRSLRGRDSPGWEVEQREGGRGSALSLGGLRILTSEPGAGKLCHHLGADTLCSG